MRDPESGNSKGYAFINFANFDGSDTALEAMNGQYLCNRPITVSYAFKKEAKGERHGSAAERLLAAQNPLSQSDKPHTLSVHLSVASIRRSSDVSLDLLINPNSLRLHLSLRRSMRFLWRLGCPTELLWAVSRCHQRCQRFLHHHLHSPW